MKNNLFYLIIFLALSAINAEAQEKNAKQSSDKNYRLELYLNGIPDGTKICMYDWMVRERHYDNIEAGVAIFEGYFDVPKSLSIIIDGYKGNIIKVIMQNDTVQVFANVNLSDDGKEKRCSITDEVILGSTLNDEYLAKTMERKKYDKLFSNDNVVKILGEKKRHELLTEAIHKILKDNKDSWWGPFLMYNMYAYFTAEVREDFEPMSINAKNSYYGRLAEKTLYPQGRIGDQITDFKINDEKGSIISLSELRKGKRLIIIDFWASWCTWCRKEIPYMKQLYEQYKNKGLQFISISIDEDINKWKNACNVEQMPWPNFHSPALSKDWGVSSLPRIVIINGDGRLIGEDWRREQMVEKVSEYFNHKE